MANRCLWKRELSQAHEASESHLLKVAALRLFHPAVSSALFGTIQQARLAGHVPAINLLAEKKGGWS